MYLQFFILPGRVHAAFPVSTFPYFSTHLSESFCTSLLNSQQILTLLSSSSHDCPSHSSAMHQMFISCVSYRINLFICNITKVYAHVKPAIDDYFVLFFVRHLINHFGAFFRNKLPRVLFFFDLGFSFLSLLTLMLLLFILLFLFFLSVSTRLTD